MRPEPEYHGLDLIPRHQPVDIFRDGDWVAQVASPMDAVAYIASRCTLGGDYPVSEAITSGEFAVEEASPDRCNACGGGPVAHCKGHASGPNGPLTPELEEPHPHSRQAYWTAYFQSGTGSLNTDAITAHMDELARAARDALRELDGIGRTPETCRRLRAALQNVPPGF